MSDNVELITRIEGAISLAFEGQGEAWSDKLSGSRLAYVATRAIEGLVMAALAQSERDLTAYKKAKSENDERFLTRALDAEQKIIEQETEIRRLRDLSDRAIEWLDRAAICLRPLSEPLKEGAP